MSGLSDKDGRLRVWLLRSRRALGLSQADLADEAGVGRTTVVTMETRGPSEVSEASRLLVIDALQRSAQARGIDLAPLPDAEAPPAQPGRRIPVIGSVPGGPTALRHQWSEATAEDGWETIDRGDLPENGTYFALRVDGDSMEPALHDGDRIVCTPMPRYEEIDPVKLNGRVVVVQFAEESNYRGETTLARWRMMGDRVVLVKDNPRYAPLEYPDDGVTGLAVVVELRRKVVGI